MAPTKSVMNQLLAIQDDRLVECRVLRDFWPFSPLAVPTPAVAGDIIHLSALRAGENAQSGHVEIITDAGVVRTIADPDYVAPVVRTVRLRWLQSGSQYRAADGTLGITQQGDEADVLEDGHAVYLMEPVPTAERVD